ncbi:helix-turn-helix domain-containing protein [Vibrio crassostreae]|uniref:helix-turn-helix domain-containing protein n=1 Tax=Vibrio crassostreae TaxID=246167 RepID=UPI001052CEB9|nr:helix-turn-helix domain-containing protein [Vibrio crassostreae]TCW22675.1 bacteriophage CI repressor-like protein [Vibrio crassostreae]
MSRIPAKVPPYEYLSGREFTEKLKEVTDCKTYELLSDHYGVPNSTFSTWHTHNRTGFELIIREHLKSGASVRYLALGEGKPFDDEQVPADSINVNSIVNGQLEDTGSLSLDSLTLDGYGLKASKTIVVEHDGQRCFINSEETHATSGRYLIEIDGAHSINHVQRLPGKKLAISFGNSTIEVSEEDINVLGRVTMSMNKE